MTYFLKSGNKFSVTSKIAMDLHENLPTGNYAIKFDERTKQYYLENIENFTYTGKVYGEINKYIERIISTFKSRDNSTGVLLNGEKGSGKTLLAKLLSINLAKESVPTLVVNECHYGEDFNNFIQSIEQPCVVIFDEFEKNYEKKEQDKILTLLDGIYPSKKLFILTSNNTYSMLSNYLCNRPGRIFYKIEFNGLSKEAIKEYCEEKLINKEHIESILTVTSLFAEFNFDMLKALVEEMNRYNETPQEALQILNIGINISEYITYEVSLKILENGELKTINNHDKTWRGNPFSDTICIEYTSDEDSSEYECFFTFLDLKKINRTNNSLLFINEHGKELLLTKKETKQLNYYNFI